VKYLALALVVLALIGCDFLAPVAGLSQHGGALVFAVLRGD
jgi:type III secretory pathway lipoprotein EscJ